jgi:hypothetical protein
MFFEGGPPIKQEDGGISCNVCAIYCCGCVETCSCSCGGNKNQENK